MDDKFSVLTYRDRLPYAALGAAFDRQLAADVGAQTGAVLFCPDVTRDPYERVGLSEDGYAAAQLACAYVGKRTSTVAYTERENAYMDARAAREVWLRPFYAPFDGMVTPATLNGEPFADSAPGKELLENKTAFGSFYNGGNPPPAPGRGEPTAETARRLAVASAVLLKNDGVLPADNAAYLGTAAAALPGYLSLRRDSFSPRAMGKVARKVQDRTAIVLLDYTDGITRAQIELVAFIAKRAPTAVVLLGTCATEIPFLDAVQGLLYAPAPGAETAVPEIVTGRCAPEGRLPFTWARPNAYPAANPKGNRPDFLYESVYTGYRYFAAAGIRPLFPFGAGRGYTDVTYTTLTVERTEDMLVVSCTIAAPTACSETTFVYLNGADDRVFGLGKRLVGFVKSALKSGENRIELRIPLAELYVRDGGEPYLPAGKYGVTVESGGEPRLYGVVKLGGKCKPRFTAAEIPSYYAGPNGLHILGTDVQKLLGVSLYGEQKSAPDAKRLARSLSVPADDRDFLRKLRGLDPSQLRV